MRGTDLGIACRCRECVRLRERENVRCVPLQAHCRGEWQWEIAVNPGFAERAGAAYVPDPVADIIL